MLRPFAIVAFALLSSTLLAGCGQKGPLYMPSDEAAQERYDPQDAYHDQTGQQQQGQQETSSSNSDDAQDSSQGDATGDATSVGDNQTTPGNDDSALDAPYNQTSGGSSPTNNAPTPNQ